MVLLLLSARDDIFRHPPPPFFQDGIEVVKLATRALVYFHVPTKTPLFFDSDGRNNIFPTVYALWRVRKLWLESGASAAETAPTSDATAVAAAGGGSAGGGGCCCPLLVVHPPVSKFLLNGADVMLPGTCCSTAVLVVYLTHSLQYSRHRYFLAQGTVPAWYGTAVVQE